MANIYNRQNPPFKANDEKPYIFISYKHDDDVIVYPMIKRFHDAGFNVWYDDGLRYGADYDDLIDMKIDGCKLFVICITERVIENAYNPKEYMKNELDVANSTNKYILPIFLDDVGLKGKYRMQLQGKHSIFRRKWGDDEDRFIEECIDAFVNHFGIEPNKADLTPDEESGVGEMDSNIVGEEEIESVTSQSEESDEQISASFPPYGGDDSYIYVAYDSNDAESALQGIEELHDLGFNVCYNNNQSLQTIENAVSNSKVFVVFMSENSIDSPDIREELFMAVDNEVPIITIRLDSTDIPRSLQSILGSQTSISRYSLSQEDFICSCIYHLEEKDIILPQNNFRYLEFMINKEKMVELHSDIVMGDDEEVGYEGIKIKTSNMVINGNGHSIDAKSKSRIFTVIGTDITFNSLTLKNAYSIHNYKHFEDIEWRGGAVYNTGSCTFDKCKFINNVVGKKIESSEHSYAYGGAIYNSGDCNLINSAFEANHAIAKDNASGNDIYGTDSCNIINCTFDGEVKTQIRKIDLFGVEYSFRNPDSDIYKLAEKFYHAWNSDDLTEFHELGDEKYCLYESNVIRAMCIANAGGAVISSSKCGELVNSGDLKGFSTINDARKLFASKMKKLGWRDGPYDFKNRTCSLYTGGGWAGDKEEEHYMRIIDDVAKTGVSFCKVSERNADAPVLQLTCTLQDETQSNEIFSQGKMQLEGNSKFKDEGMTEKPSKRDVFISYTTKNAQIANEICNALESNGIACWIAPRDISTGSNYVEQILDGIKNASKFLVIYSRDYSKSSFAKQELDTAFQLNKQLIPFNIDGSDIDGECRFFLSNIQWIDGRKDSNYSSLVDVLNGNPAPKSEPKKKGLRSRLFGR